MWVADWRAIPSSLKGKLPGLSMYGLHALALGSGVMRVATGLTSR